MIMGVIGWIVLGLTAGYIAGTLMNRRGEGPSFDIMLGIIGAVIGGWLFSAAGAAEVTGFNVWSLLAAVIGAVLLLAAWHVTQRSSRHA
jgi:uncharacterized membrane protein YeaQ/YmgE (transglycosylase-associated protein family)